MPDSPDDDGRIDTRRDAGQDLGRRLEEARQRNQPVTPAAKAAAAGAGMGKGMRSGIEFTASLVVSIAIGIALDRWLHTAPFLLLVMLVLGFAAGVFNVYRSMNDIPYGAPYNKPAAKAPAAKDDTDET